VVGKASKISSDLLAAKELSTGINQQLSRQNHFVSCVFCNISSLENRSIYSFVGHKIMALSRVVTAITAFAALFVAVQSLTQPIRLTRYLSATGSPPGTQLHMVFSLKEGQTTNMFDGPLALTQERDACGVGFIVNTQDGGTLIFANQKMKAQIVLTISILSRNIWIA
jgi:hypothetical protein